MPDSLWPGYSQSMSRPSASRATSICAALSANALRPAAVLAASENPPAAQPPTEMSTFNFGLRTLRATTGFSLRAAFSVNTTRPESTFAKAKISVSILCRSLSCTGSHPVA